MRHLEPNGCPRRARALVLAIFPLALAAVSCIEGQAPRAVSDTGDAPGTDGDVERDATTPDSDALVEDTIAEALDETRPDAAEDVSGDTLGDTAPPTDTVPPSCNPPCRNGGVCAAAGICSCADGWQGPTCEVPACGEVACPALPGYTPACNSKAHCEYTRTAPTEPWHADDVWIYVPPGTLQMGTPQGEAEGLPVERPLHEVAFARGFFIGKYEVTVRLHEACEAAGACTAPRVDLDPSSDWGLSRSTDGRALHPQNGLAWNEAETVCAFLGGRKPTSAEWEYAAKGPDLHRIYPWGDEPYPECGVHAVYADVKGGLPFNGRGCGTGGTFAVGPSARTAGMSATGALDMAGNLMEWVEDCKFADYVSAPDDGSAWTLSGDCARRTVRGGSFVTVSNQVRAGALWWLPLGERNSMVGARCVRALP